MPREVPEGRAILTFTPEDETEYLLRSPANREQLSKAVDHIEKGQNLVSFETLEDAIKQAQDRLST
ncbi:hypothetical protein FACS1894147_12010 [Spirochaetia bacterium]|nr:hypothetical protein FACS1894147_12010 [Spirochaetia bacterium]